MRMLALLLCSVSALVQRRAPLPRAPTRSQRAHAPSIAMIISPEAMVKIQKLSNKAEFEDTVARYAKEKKLSARDAELEYARYLIDPDKFVLDAAAAAQKTAQKRPENVRSSAPGQRRSPLLQAYIDEGGAEVEARITKFERENTIKACAIIAVLFGGLIANAPH